MYIFIKNRVSPTGRDGGSTPHQPKICSFLPPPGKFSPEDSHPPPNFYFSLKIQVPPLNNNF